MGAVVKPAPSGAGGSVAGSLGRFTAHSLAAGIAEMFEHEQAQGRRQIAVNPLLINRTDELRPISTASLRNLVQRLPERLLQAHAGLAPGQ
jgi:hypothetical protein